MYNLKFYLILTMLSIAISAEAQTTAFFEFPIYFEDAMGNKDTVIIGADPIANNGWLIEQFDEIIDNSPFDTIMDVRLLKQNENFLKKAVTNNWGDLDCFDAAETYLPLVYFNTNYYPITVSYDSTILINNLCEYWRFALFNTTLEFIVATTIDIHCSYEGMNCASYCFAQTSSFQIYEEDIYEEDLMVYLPFAKEIELIDGTDKTLRPFIFLNFNESTEFGCTEFVNTKDFSLQEKLIKNTLVERNLYLNGNQIEKIEIINMHGKIVFANSLFTNQTIDVGFLNKGLYAIKVTDNNQKNYTDKFFKY